MDKNSEDYFCFIFDEICKGSSEISFLEEFLYIKHPSVSDFVKMKSKHMAITNNLVMKGVPSKEEAEKEIKSSPLYPHELEDEAKELNLQIESIKDYIKTQFVKAKIIREKSRLKELELDLQKINSELSKYKPVGTAEDMAENRVNIEFLINSIYREPECLNLRFLQDDVDYMDDKTLSLVSSLYSSFRDDFDGDIIQKLVLADFFQPYSRHCKNGYEFFGQPIVSMSQNKIHLLYYANLFESIFKNYGDKMPESIRKSPKDIFEFVEGVSYHEDAERKSASRAEKSGANFVMSTKFGARQEDYERMGINQRVIKPQDILKKGEVLNSEQTMQAFAKQAGLMK